MQYISVTSSNIAEVGYDDTQSVLGVKFLNGTEYHYHGVPRDVYDGCCCASSVGQYFNTYVKRAGYSFTKIS